MGAGAGHRAGVIHGIQKTAAATGVPGGCFLISGLYYSQIKPSCSITDRQVTLRSLTTFFFIASRWETMGDFIPQTPSLGTSPQIPSSLRAYSSLLSEKSIR